MPQTSNKDKKTLSWGKETPYFPVNPVARVFIL